MPVESVSSVPMDFGFVSVVMIAVATSPQRAGPRAISFTAAAIRATGRGTPMTPVLATATSYGSQPIFAAAASAIAMASRSPCGPVQAFAFPELTTIPRSFPRSRCRRGVRIEHADERLLGVFARVRARDVLGAPTRTERGVTRRDQTAVHRDEMRSERDAGRLAQKRRGLLRDLRRVPVLRHAVGANALVDRSEEVSVFDRVPRPADA